MKLYIPVVLKTLVLGLLMVSVTVNASTTQLDEAIKIYYDGLPDQAIAMLKPLAQSGNTKAQLLLGNILHSLSRSKSGDAAEDPITWYQMAAAKGSPEANYLLGVIYHNKWTNTQQEGSNTKAITYYETAAKLGNKSAQGPLIQLKYRDQTASKKSKPAIKPKAARAPKKEEPQIVAIKEIEEPVKQPAVNAIVKNKEILEEPQLASNTEEPVITESNIEKSNKQALDDLLSRIALLDNKNSEDKILSEVNLLDVITQCKNFTHTGFAYYAESIRGAHLTGNATISSISATNSSDNNLVHLTKKQEGVTLFLALEDVPGAIGKRLKKSDVFSISAIVGNASKSEPNCKINLVYEPIELEG